MELGENDLWVFHSSSGHPTATCIIISHCSRTQNDILLTEVVLELWSLNE